MHDLDFDGQEPLWSKIDFLEQTGMARQVDPNNLKSLQNEIERLKMDKCILAAELEKF